jgi:ABC-type histidine transport system ATPase subunit
MFASFLAMTYKADRKHTEPLSPFPTVEAAERQIMIAIEARDITKSFGSAQVLKGISLSAEQGDVISIIGASGSGKSTFLRCLNLLEVPDRGEIRVGEEHLEIGGGKALDRRQVERIRRRVAMVFQSFNLWHHMTVVGNVIEAPIHVHGRPRAEAIEEAMALLAKVGLSHRANAYPGQLSGGEQQRAAIARALAVHPNVILFDEPTSALDPELVGEVLSVMQGLAAEGRTMIIVTHEMAFARDVSTRTLFLCEGRIEEEGDSTELFNAPKSTRLEQFLATFRTGRFTTNRQRATVPDDPQ